MKLKQQTKLKQTEVGRISIGEGIEKDNELPILGKLPEIWRIVELNSVLNTDGTRNGIYKSKTFHGKGVKMINMGELFANPRLKNIPMRRVDLSEEELKRFNIKIGDLLFARRSLTAKGAGKCSIVLEVNEPTTFESSIIRVRPNSELADSLFLYYLFSSQFGYYTMNSILRQVAVSGITGTDLAKVKIPLPPISEQHAIAQVLNILDNKIDLNHKMNATLEKIGQALFKHWFVDFEFPNYEGRPYRSSGGEMVESELGEVPKGWMVGTLSEYIDFVKGKKPKEVTTEKLDGYLPQILIDTLDGKNFSYADPTNLVACNENEIIMVMDGASSGRIEIGFEGILGSTLAKITFKNNAINSSYLYFILLDKQQEIKENTTGSAIPHADKKRVLFSQILIPDNKTLLNFQKLIIQLFDKIRLNKKEIKSLSQIRDVLLPKLMSGEIRVKREDKND